MTLTSQMGKLMPGVGGCPVHSHTALGGQDRIGTQAAGLYLVPSKYSEGRTIVIRGAGV